MALGIAVVCLDMKIWHIFPNIVTTMGSSHASCHGVFTVSAAYAAAKNLFRFFWLFCVLTVGPDLSFWFFM